jgi:hypothetical protein
MNELGTFAGNCGSFSAEVCAEAKRNYIRTFPAEDADMSRDCKEKNKFIKLECVSAE